jgi:hypothetical protein
MTVILSTVKDSSLRSATLRMTVILSNNEGFFASLRSLRMTIILSTAKDSSLRSATLRMTVILSTANDLLLIAPNLTQTFTGETDARANYSTRIVTSAGFRPGDEARTVTAPPDLPDRTMAGARPS